ncbi:MAG TPA: MFS transporter [Vicinamibacterales bacterium]|nr:MFS transporter [Vicinamibacterales bacterium]
MTSLLERIGLGRPELRAWAMYDWANSAFWTTVIVAVFPPFFSEYAAQGLPAVDATSRFAWATTIAVTIVAVIAPILGAIADQRAMKKRLLGVFLVIGVAATLLMGTIGRGQWMYALVLFVIANVGVAATLVFYDSLLPHIAAPDELDRVSTAGFAIGFIGGGVLLLVNLAWILSPATFGIPDTVAAIKLSLMSVGVWWLVFSIPLFRRVPEPVTRPSNPSASPRRGVDFRSTLGTTWATFQELRRNRNAFLLLIAFLLYNDGIQTIIRMSSIYGAEIGIDRNAQIAAFVMVQFVGVPCSFLFGTAAGRVGAKAALFFALGVYAFITVLGYFLMTAGQFFALAFLVGTVQGGSQALSRSLFARMIPKEKSSECFGFFAVFEKFAGIAGPAVFAASISFFQSSRAAVLSVLLFFVAGAIVLTQVDVAAGEAEAARGASL